MHIYTAISVEKQCPFFVMIAPTEVISFGFVEQKMVQFYEQVFSTSDIMSAYQRYLQQQMTLFHSEVVSF
jgi:hypothetical protein